MAKGMLEILIESSKQGIDLLPLSLTFNTAVLFGGSAGTSEINQLQKLQNRAAGIIKSSSFDTPSRPLIEGLGWKSNGELISDECKKMVFKALNELAPQCLCNFFIKNSQCPSHNLRNTETSLRLTNGQKCFSFRGAWLWNSLPAQSKKTTSDSLKRNLV